MIRVDQLGRVHVVWTNGVDAGLIHRHIYYNLYDSTEGWMWGEEGTLVENSLRSGFTFLGVKLVSKLM